MTEFHFVAHGKLYLIDAKDEFCAKAISSMKLNTQTITLIPSWRVVHYLESGFSFTRL